MSPWAAAYLTLMILAALVGIVNHGEPRPPHSAATALLGFGLSFWLLYMAGFWK
ncbi:MULTISPECIES: hypothetical protein [Meridianimarinicoccus]|uniref:hypothetical protein n=1 Tax=Meridianimarinicoccus zhengii TaxID=2056810 RepID=UPI0013A6AE23|nr:hypothetical protein [Phycocomes zhengii]